MKQASYGIGCRFYCRYYVFGGFDMSVEEYYGLDFSIKSFAVANQFVEFSNKACYSLGTQLRPFGFNITDLQVQYGVLDIADFLGFLGEEKTISQEITDFRRGVFTGVGIHVDTSDPVKQKLLLIDYLMTISICYVEIPKYTTKEGFATQTFDKYLCTRNPAIMAAWMGCEPNEMQAKYSARIASTQVDFNANSLRFVKLNHAAKGNSITLPRSAASVGKMRCVPLYMLYAFVEGFRPALETGILKFTFAKDNGTVREMCSTLSEDIIRQYYTDNMFVNTMLTSIDFKSVQQGGMTLGSKMHRGYVRIPELGASVYDATGTRSLNLARILRVEKVAEADRTYINVDLNSVCTNFDNSLDFLAQTMPECVEQCYKELLGTEADVSRATTMAQQIEECKAYVRSRSAFFSTAFHRDLHKFLISYPGWFPLYTGKPAQQVTSSANYGVTDMDF